MQMKEAQCGNYGHRHMLWIGTSFQVQTVSESVNLTVLSSMVVTSHTWLLSIWNVASLNWDMLLTVKYTLDYFEYLVW